jgi:hypothetical protein
MDSRRGGPSETAVGAAEEAGAARGAAVGAARGRNPGQSGKGSHKWLESRRDLRGRLARCQGTYSGESGSNGGDRGARLKENLGPFEKKYRSVGLGEAARGKLSSLKITCRDDQTIYGEIKATVAFVIRGVAKKDTPSRARSELMRRGCSSVRVTHAAKNSEMLI